MARVFAALAAANIILLAGTALLGLLTGDDSADRHVLLAVLTLLLSCFVQVVVFTYFTVTGKLIGQAVHIRGIESTPVDEAKRIKRTATHGVAIVVGSLLPTIVTGALLWRERESAVWHLFAVILLAAVHVAVYRREYALILTNASLVSRTVEAYAARKEGAEDAAKRS